jgi:hypothetical protein
VNFQGSRLAIDRERRQAASEAVRWSVLGLHRADPRQFKSRKEPPGAGKNYS